MVDLDAERLRTDVRRLEAEVERLRAELDLERRRLRDELAFAHRVQLNLMPATLPELDGWELATAYRPAREVGGDFFDVYRLPKTPTTIGFVIADVTGKGVTAALMMAFTRAVLRAAAYNGRSPADALRRTNRVLVREARTGLFVTALVGWLDTVSGRTRWASAGHEAPFILRSGSGRFSRLRCAGDLLGVFDRISVDDRMTTLAPGDALLAYTDGVIDARRDDGTFFGEPGVIRALRTAASTRAALLVRAVDEAVADFTGPAPAADDLTILAVSRTAGSASA